MGAILLAFGFLLAALVTMGVWQMASTASPDPGISAGIGLLTLIATFCLYVGARLFLHLPNARGSLLGPIGWYAVATFIGGMCVILAVTILIKGMRPDDWKSAIFALIFGAVFCAGCIWSARARLALHQMAPHPLAGTTAFSEDAVAWVIIRNDDHTPMEFVVQVLSETFFLSRDRAIALMSHVHHSGSARVPCASAEEAAASAARIMQQARAAGHPLMCESAIGSS